MDYKGIKEVIEKESIASAKLTNKLLDNVTCQVTRKTSRQDYCLCATCSRGRAILNGLISKALDDGKLAVERSNNLLGRLDKEGD